MESRNKKKRKKEKRRELPFQPLPTGVHLNIMSYLSPSDGATVTRLNKQSCTLFHDNTCWKSRFIRHFPHRVGEYNLNKPLDFRALFIEEERNAYTQCGRLFHHIKECDANTLQLLPIDYPHLEVTDSQEQKLIFWTSVKGHQSLLDLYFNKQLFIRSSVFKANHASRALNLSVLCRQGLDAMRTILDALTLQEKVDAVNRPYEGDKTPLTLATLINDEESVNYLLTQHADVNHTDLTGRTALHYAAQYGLNRIVDILLNHHAHTNVLDNEFRTPIWLAAANNNERCMQLLTARGADVNQVLDTLLGNTALTEAATIGRADMISILLKHGANPHHTCLTSNATAAHLAIPDGHIDCVHELLRYSHDILTAKAILVNQQLPEEEGTSHEVTPEDCAIMLNQHEIATLLRSCKVEIENIRPQKY
tara:strand:+ start:1461 stop:2726 length:1266 start_codon:yes stop_codon:yes gene_type:complete